MKIGMALYDMQKGGGLEEYSVNLAIALKQQGHQVSVVSTAWVSPENQYLRRLSENGIACRQLPQWLSHLASDADTKDKVQARLMWILSPLVLILTIGLAILRKKPWQQAWVSAHGWLRGKLMSPLVRRDWRKPFARVLLDSWRISWQPDILHIQGYTTNLLFVIDWAHRRKLPVVYEEHQTPDAQFNWWKGFEKTINQAAVVVAVSEKSAEGLRLVAGVSQPIVVRNPLLADPLAAGLKRHPALQPDHRPLRLTTVARLSIAKGLTYLLEAIVLAQKTHSSAQFRIYGDGELKAELLDYAARLGLNGPEIFVGAFNRDDLPQIMLQTDIFVMSSVLEGQPLALVEAMAYGCPIVATTVGGIPELIKDGINGLLCEPKNSAGLAAKICTLLDDAALRESLGQAARQTYQQGNFQPAALATFFVALYEKILRGKPV